MSLVPLAVIAFSATAALITELLQWVFVWRTPGFQALKANLAKHAAKVEEAKEGTQTAKNVKKKEARLQTWREAAAKQVAQYNMKAGVVTMACMFATYKGLTRTFGGLGPVVALPFEPPAFLQKITHRGLTGADPREGSALFIFVLCQMSIRAVIAKLCNLGMGREFQDIMPTLGKKTPFGSFFEEDSKRK
ncbi:Transmembrane and coiled-coil domain-containing 1 [Micractinium conductrix]|uniref:Transmembrane and coiled-coil domain-containing 1 n=1 Tax=Micractinium conductrix TaxID=554055 RepID=A0A2P6VFN0_9CHLO|nr:Transmembrane and coiled-coil domain-containing 1 [Micractinium conductrix]|eukprot:PSC72904.1 Transmembrane and coiled-coil domain-containing 1 [Micractinium conductrix]